MTKRGTMKPQTRLHYLDNLRIYLTILVILHHNAIAYSGSGPWGIIDPGADEISSILFLIFTAVNQTYFMAAFFLLAGYFTPRSLENKGPQAFLLDRLLRLGIPVLVYTTLIVNINGLILDRLVYQTPFHVRLGWDVGPLWFLVELMFFSSIYVIWKAVRGRAGLTKLSQIGRDNFPADSVLLAAILILGLGAFGVRLIWPVGEWHFGIQPGQFLQYIFSFFVGIQAYRGNWFDRLTRAQAHRWGRAVIFIFLTFFPATIVGGVLEDVGNLAKFMGGLHWQALAYSIWEMAMFMGIAIFLIYIFRERLNISSKLTRFLAANTFTVYIIHQTVLYFLEALGLSVELPVFVKFIGISLIAVPLSFLLSDLIRRIPYAKRVLG